MANTSAYRYGKEYWKFASELKASLKESKFEPLYVNGLDAVLPAGIQRGRIAEIAGSRSTGRASMCFRLLAQATGEGETCAVVDTGDAFDPHSAESAGVALNRLIWVRCGGYLEHALRATDLLLHAGGFGVVTLDLCEANPRHLNRIPLSYWHRFRRVLENTATVLLVCTDQPQAKSCASISIQAKTSAVAWAGVSPFSRLAGLEVHATPRKLQSIRPQPLFLKTPA